ncbi:leucine-rich repeat domain-containing protein [Myxococcus sp. K38C18041901]|uniref:leucine-rich repeat domain-containing protein n=1 Tax=Myxococcus guangdongensis TaxID=2906760 RepID=UPI0020A7C2E9|nr:leucine-rich repeat domain-containing protein [Myxococcus guangdongensis]MCP3058832.1 leucine-rich repeat domain-containing protein [Myxococcus guangdongensis]
MPKKSVSPTTQWKKVEKQATQVLGKGSAGRYPEDLEPRVVPFASAPDVAPLLPPEYVEFIEALGYRWLSTSESTLGFLPPRWRVSLSQQTGVPDRSWIEVRAEREAGTHPYSFVMFAARDLEDVNGFAFGKGTQGDGLVVWSVEESLPVDELGSFSHWLAEELDSMAASLADVEEGATSQEPPDLENASLPTAKKKAPAAAKAKGAFALFDTFPRDSKELLFNGRKLGELPPVIGEFTELQSLWVRTTGIQQVPPELGRLTKLKKLDLSFNPLLVELPPELGNLESLESLDLRQTGVKTLPDSLERLRGLKYLDLQSTPLTTVPPVLFRMPWLRALDLYSTTLPPQEIEQLRRALPECKLGLN